MSHIGRNNMSDLTTITGPPLEARFRDLSGETLSELLDRASARTSDSLALAVRPTSRGLQPAGRLSLDGQELDGLGDGAAPLPGRLLRPAAEEDDLVAAAEGDGGSLPRARG